MSYIAWDCDPHVIYLDEAAELGLDIEPEEITLDHWLANGNA